MKAMRSETSRTSPRGHAWLRVDVTVALLALAILLPSSIAMLTEPATRPEQQILTPMIMLYLALHLTPLLAVRRPVLAIVLANAVMCGLVLVPGIRAASGALLPSGAAYLLVIGQVAAQSSRTMRVLALAGGVFGAALIAFTELRLDDADLRLGAFLGLSGAIAAAWAMGLVLRVRRDQAEERMTARVAQAIADERGRINRDLHDIVAHSMTVMIAQAEVARALRADDTDRSDAALMTVVRTGREALRGMRAVVADDAPREPLPTIDSLDALVESVRTPSTHVRLTEHGTRGDLRADAALALHHAVREALTNAVRHNAPPVAVEVQLDWQPVTMRATVADDGGAGTVMSDLGSGVGLVGITERVRLAGGALTARRGDQRGWIVTVDLPTRRSTE